MRLFPASLAAALVTVRGQIRMSSSLPVAAVCQMTATPDKEANFSACTRLVEQAKEGGASMVFLPEGFDYIGSSREETLALSESLDGDIITRYTHLARKLDLWLSLGGFHERGHDWKTDRRIYNSHVIINGQGEVVSVYRKAHLFDVELTGKGVSLKESAFTVVGPRLLPPVQTPIGKVGLGVCYDLRFPELSSALQRHGAEILTFPSAFTVATGAAHWEVLLRARAIETQCFVLAAAQVGSHHSRRASYGHALAVDPWGGVIGDCGGTDAGVTLVQIDLQTLRDIRRDMPVQQHRREKVLLRARAIETQCFVLAAAQVGSHHSRRASYGHALAVDPWGGVIGDCGGTDAGVTLVQIDLQTLRDIRRDMPVQQHRREKDFYCSLD